MAVEETADRPRSTRPASEPYGDHADLVLEGGGVKGLAHVGALEGLYEGGVRVFPRIAGTSAGAIVAALLAAGMPITAMKKTMMEMPFREFRSRTGIARVPIAGKAASVAWNRGIYDPGEFRRWMDGQLRELDTITFGDLRITDPTYQVAEDERNYSLVVMAADITNGWLVRLPWDYERLYGLPADEQPVVDAVRASMSIPFYFKPFELTDADSSAHTLVDGGVLSNFAIDVFDRRDGETPRWPTFGVKLLPELPAGRTKIFPLLGRIAWGPIRDLELLVSTMLVGRDQTLLSQPWVRVRTIQLDTSEVGVLDWRVEAGVMERLHHDARDAARRFMEHWDFEEYKRRFRS
jgi:NTE family protein